MAYTPEMNKSSQRYVRHGQKSILIKFRKDDYDKIIQPAVQKTGMPMVTFIKEAIFEKIEREQLLDR